MQYPTISEYVKAIQDASDNLDMSTEATNAELLKEAITDEFGVEYSKDGRKLLKAPQKLDSTSTFIIFRLCAWHMVESARARDMKAMLLLIIYIIFYSLFYQ